MSACARDADVRTLKMAHSLDHTHPVHQAIVFMSERLDEISGGTMKIDIYPGGQLGSERELMELLQIGSLAMTKVSSSPMEGFVPAMKVFNIPYVFRDNDHFWRVLNSDQGKQLLLAGDAVNLRGLGYFDAGSRSFYNVDTPVNTPDDLAGQKIRVQQSQTALKMVQALGGSPTPISWGELYTALSQGVVDGAENNPPSFYTSKHFEVCKYYTLNEHTSVPDIVLISSYIWNSLNAQQQQWLQQAMDEAVVYQRKLWAEKTEEALVAVEAAGVTIIRPDKAPFMEKVQPMHDSYKGTELYELIQTFKSM
ncbi:TRAP transporter substrate-binding protein [Gilvimarinus sp. SDUM040014]|uniref:TRAP transporter substrate-binding protein n=2 Tax=Gilvimarinus algae TaxID=3058037 RepID=A0ABT8T9S1_9GAMM|nr:TRAP transporter substrate-binding protein [Gilvimarinus sp. SDUM040014]MDO3380691.1 TRAP transporter substrate-binding protein [Gilvimarinus sp. SDUM040014]